MDIALLKAVTAFVATNLDDLIILMLFFAQVKPTFRKHHIISGQYLGFSLLLLASLPGFLGGLIIPDEWIGLLGFLPLAIGIKLLLHPEETEEEVQTVSEKFDQASTSNPFTAKLTQLLSPQTCKVAAVTVANGGDNISIYVPLFASSNLLELGILLFVFFVMVAVWCLIAAVLVRHRTITTFLSKYGEKLVPFVFVGLGLWILFEAGTIQAINNLI